MGARTLLRKNLLLNPRGANSALTIDTGPNVTTTFLSNGAEVLHNVGVAGNAYYAARLNVTTGTTYYGRIVLDILSGSPSLNVAFHGNIGMVLNGATTVISTTVGNTVIAECTATSNIDGVARLLLDFRGSGVGESFKIREMIVTDQPNTSPYFDGSSMETRDRFYNWSGMVHGSTSNEWWLADNGLGDPISGGASLANLKRRLMEIVLGPDPVRVSENSKADIKREALEKLLGDNGLI